MRINLQYDIFFPSSNSNAYAISRSNVELTHMFLSYLASKSISVGFSLAGRQTAAAAQRDGARGDVTGAIFPPAAPQRGPR